MVAEFLVCEGRECKLDDESPEQSRQKFKIIDILRACTVARELPYSHNKKSRWATTGIFKSKRS